MKGIAIQTILLLLVGVLVVGILVYLVYRFATGSTTMSTIECINLVTSWCTTCMTSNWNTGISLPDNVRTCAQKLKAGSPGWGDNNNCGDGGSGRRDWAIGDCCYTVNVGCGQT